MTSPTTTPQDAANFINEGIGRLTRALMDQGATEERAFDVAYQTTICFLATERPDLLKKYVLAMVAQNPDLDPFLEGLPDEQAAVAQHRAKAGI